MSVFFCERISTSQGNYLVLFIVDRRQIINGSIEKL